MTSAGIRSGVNWMRRKLRSSTRPRVLTSSVFPSPGTPSRSTLPPHSTAVERALDHALLADDDLADLGAYALEVLLESVHFGLHLPFLVHRGCSWFTSRWNPLVLCAALDLEQALGGGPGRSPDRGAAAPAGLRSGLGRSCFGARGAAVRGRPSSETATSRLRASSAPMVPSPTLARRVNKLLTTARSICTRRSPTSRGIRQARSASSQSTIGRELFLGDRGGP